MRHRIGWIAIVLAGTLVGGEPLKGQAPPVDVKQFDIAPQPLDSALLEFSKQAGLQLVVSGNLVEGKETIGFVGEEIAENVLLALLEDTNLEFRTVGSTLTITNGDPEVRDGPDSPRSGQDEPVNAGSTESESRELGNGDGGAEDIQELGDYVVTGTRLRLQNVSPASPIIVIGQEELGQFNSVEDVLRALPQNYSGFNSSSHAEGTAPRNSDGALVADLRGLGFGATLILINGRRTAASPAENLSYTDISTIPYGAIERIEIMPDGGSAVYGADAVGGVINFILKRDYVGAESRVRYENSRADAHTRTVDQLIGFGWLTGKFTGSIRYKDTDPSNAHSVGISSLDHRSRGGRDYRNAFVNALRGTPFGTVTIPGAPPNTALGVLPVGNGVGLTANGLAYVSQEDYDSQSGSYELARPSSIGLSQTIVPESSVLSGSFTFTQQFSDGIESYLDGSFSRRESMTEGSGYNVESQRVPTSNIYNGFGQTVLTSYDFSSEIAMGLMPAPVNESEAIRFGVNAGADIQLPFRNWSAKIDLGYSRDATEGVNHFINTYGSDFDGGQGPGAASFLAYTQALASDLNLFGNGTAQASAQTLQSIVYSRDIGERTSDLTSLELSASGSLFEGWIASAISAAVGMEYREEELDNRHYAPAPFSFEGLLGQPGPEFVPARELRAAFFEFDLPIVGETNRSPGLHELRVTLQGRYENYSIVGPFGEVGVDFTDFSFTFPDESEVDYSKFSPKIGVTWYPNDELKFRSTFSEGFQSPTLPELFTPVVPRPAFQLDPLTGGFGFVVQFYGGNPHLQPQESESLTVGFDYKPVAFPGLTLAATWQRVEFTGQIALPAFSLGALLYTNPGSFPNIVTTTRIFEDSFGELTAINFLFDNVVDQEVEAIDVDLRYSFETGLGSFAIGLAATHTINNTREMFADVSAELASSSVDTSSFVQRVDNTNLGPPRWKANAYLDYARRNWSGILRIRHSGSYKHFGFPGIASASAPTGGIAQVQVASYTTFDAQVNYHLDASGWRFSLGATNLFDKGFPFIDVPLGADGSRVDFRRRVIHLAVSKSLDF